MTQTLWEIKSVDRVVRVPGMPPVTVPVFPSLLVAEEEYFQSLRDNEEISDKRLMDLLVAFCLKHRGVLGDDVPTEKIIANTPRPLAEALFSLFIYGLPGKRVNPTEYIYDPETELGNDENQSQSTGENSVGNYSAGIQAANISDLPSLEAVRQNSPWMPPESGAMTA